MSKAVIILSKGQAIAVAAVHGEKAPHKPNQRLELGGAKLWHMPKNFRAKRGHGKGKTFRLSAEHADTLRPYLKVASETGRTAILSYENDD